MCVPFALLLLVLAVCPPTFSQSILDSFSYNQVRLSLKQLDFLLFTRAHFALYSDREAFDAAFLAQLPIKIVIHGWNVDVHRKTVPLLRDAYLQHVDCNVIAVDWPNDDDFPTSADSVAAVGRAVARLVDDLHERLGAPMGGVHLIGHSLGAHVAGVAGSQTHERVSRISGLDPAGPRFYKLATATADRLDSGDADFVDVIHTAGGVQGELLALGHVDFYPNGGTWPQPGARPNGETWESHFRAVQLFGESIDVRQEFWGHGCWSWRAFVEGECGWEPTARMGEPAVASQRGQMYLATRERSPYAMGKV